MKTPQKQTGLKSTVLVDSGDFRGLTSLKSLKNVYFLHFNNYRVGKGEDRQNSDAEDKQIMLVERNTENMKIF